jgi:hypothetical protein
LWPAHFAAMARLDRATSSNTMLKAMAPSGRTMTETKPPAS